MPIYKALFAFAAFFISISSLANENYTEGYIKVDKDIQLFFQKTGTGSQTLIIPAGFFLYDDFKHLGRDRTVIFYDMRNRGRSSYVKDSTLITIDKDIEDLEAVRKHFKLQKVDLLGWSFLGMMVMLYTQQHPHHVGKVIQIGPVPLQWNEKFPDSLTYKPAIGSDTAYRRVIKAAREAGMEANHPGLFSKLIFDLLQKESLVGGPGYLNRIGCQWGQHAFYTNEHYANFMRHLRFHFEQSIQNKKYDKASFKDLRHPVLTIHGTRDRNAFFGAGKQWTELLPNSRLVRVEGAGHIPWVEAPELVFESITRFLK